MSPDDTRALYMGANGLVGLGERERGLEWARRALEKAHHSKIEALFPVRLLDLAAQPMQRQQVLGMTTHTRLYTGSAERQIEAVLIEGLGNPGLSAIEQLSRLLGAQINAESRRIDGRDAMLVPLDDEGHAVLTVKLESGATLKFTATNLDPEQLLEAARSFGAGMLDDYLSGKNPDVKSTI